MHPYTMKEVAGNNSKVVWLLEYENLKFYSILLYEECINM